MNHPSELLDSIPGIKPNSFDGQAEDEYESIPEAAGGPPLGRFRLELLDAETLQMRRIAVQEFGLIQVEFMAPLMMHRPERPYVMADIKRHRLMPRSRVVHQ